MAIGKKVQLTEVEMFASRKTLKEALDYFYKMMDTVHDPASKMAVYTGFMVVYNTLAIHYEIHAIKKAEKKTRDK